MQTYCGNNSNHPLLVNQQSVLGTRYNCLRKGIGKGYRLPVDNGYENYQPIDTRKIYCGNDNIIPNEYDSMGNLTQCLQKGIGIGKKMKYEKYGPDGLLERHKTKIIPFVVFVISLLLCYTIMYVSKPDFIYINKKDMEIDIWKMSFISVVISGCITLFFIFYLHK